MRSTIFFKISLFGATKFRGRLCLRSDCILNNYGIQKYFIVLIQDFYLLFFMFTTQIAIAIFHATTIVMTQTRCKFWVSALTKTVRFMTWDFFFQARHCPVPVHMYLKSKAHSILARVWDRLCSMKLCYRNCF